MNINVHVKNTAPDTNTTAAQQQKETIASRIEKALKHVATSVRSVDVHVEDETPGSTKFDGKCRIVVHFEKGNPITVEGHGENFNETLADGVKRVQHAAEKVSQKKIEKKRRQPNSAS